MSSTSKWKEEQTLNTPYTALVDQRADSHRAHTLPYRSTYGSSWSSPGVGLNSQSIFFSTSLSLLIDKTIKPSCWNSLKWQVWKDRRLGSDQWEWWQSNNLPSRVALIKICSPMISLSSLLFKFIHSLLSGLWVMAIRDPSQSKAPRGTHNPNALHSTGFWQSADRRCCLRKAQNHIPCNAAYTHQEEATETTSFIYSFTLNKLRKKDCYYCPWDILK